MNRAAEILAAYDQTPSLSRCIGAVRQLEQLAADEPATFRHLDVVIVRNFTIEPIEPELKLVAFRSGLHLDVRYTGYDPSVDDSAVGPLNDEGIVIVALRLEELSPRWYADFLELGESAVDELTTAAVDRVVRVAVAARGESGSPVFVHNFVPPLNASGGIADSQDAKGQLNRVRAMNVDLARRLGEMNGLHLVDVEHLFAAIGLSNCFDARGDRVSGAPLSLLALKVLADALVRQIKALRGPAVKCVVVDCDNTLWGGVIGEDGLSGIVLDDSGPGRRHRELQSQLLNLRRRGVVLAISSKNNEADVLEVFRKHPGCVLREGDFAVMRINWEDKATGVESIAAELDIGLDHVAFIDDDPAQCEWIKQRLPEVKVVVWPADVERSLDDLRLFDALVVTNDDRERTERYRAQAERRAVRASVASIEDYLLSLGTVATTGVAGPEHLARLAQLTQRTNQFNLTTRRYDVSGLEGLVADPSARVVWLELRDRFGEHGITGCGIIRCGEGEALIDTLLLSCRVLGRQAETVIVRELARAARGLGASTLIGEYLPSGRNAQVADLYGRLGFEPVTDGRWTWRLDRGDPEIPNWLEVVEAVTAP